ncbi:MAG: SDR family NAD(P)-dependent oxidoreductase [Parachlamydiales bacterium]|jgi:short-subunit dehydrogenase
MKRAIIVGASSGIGYELAKILAEDGYEIGLVARRHGHLLKLQEEIPTKTHVRPVDVSLIPETRNAIESIILELGGVDLFIINAGIGFLNPHLEWQHEKDTIDVNVYGFCALANLAYRYFTKQGHGHLVGISSIGALRGNALAPAYNASKAFMSNYLEGLQKRAAREQPQITVTDIQPGAVHTAMMKGEGHFWIASPKKAAAQIFNAIRHKKRHAYITKRWRLIAWLLKVMPRCVHEKI